MIRWCNLVEELVTEITMMSTHGATAIKTPKLLMTQPDKLLLSRLISSPESGLQA